MTGGGPISAGQRYLVGERGPEYFVPGRSGTILPNGAGGGNGYVTVQVAGSVATEQDLVEAVRRGLIQTGRRNGGAAVVLG